MRTTLGCLLGAAVLALAGCGGSDRTDDPARAGAKPDAARAASATSASDAEIDRSARTITYEGEDGETALDLLREHGYDVEVESSDLGDYVTGIGDVHSTKTEYWLFEVDGKMPTVGADKLVTKDGQQVEWRYGS